MPGTVTGTNRPDIHRTISESPCLGLLRGPTDQTYTEKKVTVSEGAEGIKFATVCIFIACARQHTHAIAIGGWNQAGGQLHFI
jgi:hypothetical protein